MGFDGHLDIDITKSELQYSKNNFDKEKYRDTLIENNIACDGNINKGFDSHININIIKNDDFESKKITNEVNVGSIEIQNTEDDAINYEVENELIESIKSNNYGRSINDEVDNNLDSKTQYSNVTNQITDDDFNAAKNNEDDEESIELIRSRNIEKHKEIFAGLFKQSSRLKPKELDIDDSLDKDEDDLEQIRQRNIEKNKQLFKELFNEDNSIVKVKVKEKTKRIFRIKEPVERRSSSRIRGERVRYNEYELDKLFDDDDKLVSRKRKFEPFIENSFKIFTNKFPKISAKRTPVPELPVSEVTQEHIDNISDRAFEKVYSKQGSSCHQCRQKTIDTKTFCRSGTCTGVRGQFCGPCLDGRYGEKVAEALLDPNWSCPPCRGICNCSICLSRQGYAPTGILRPVAIQKGYRSVKHYLEAVQKEINGESVEKKKSNNKSRKNIFAIEEFSEESAEEFFGFE